MIFPFVFPDGQIVDAGEATLHESLHVELPVFIAIRAKPMAGIVTPFVGEAHRDPIFVEGPEFLDQAIVEFAAPFACKKLDDGFAPAEKFRAISPNAVRSVRE